MRETIVSIIMPVYNAADFLRESVGDVLAQTFDDYELICVDDGSTDGSSNILDKFSESDHRIRVIHQQNMGGGAARNTGLDAASGKYLLFLDADDRFEKDLLKVAVDTAEKENCDVVVYDVDTFDYMTGRTKAAPWIITDTDIKNDRPFNCFNNSVWNKLFRRELIVRNNIRFTERRAAYSTSFVACAILSADSIRIIRRVLLHYRSNNPNSNVSNEDKDSTAIVEALMTVKRYLISNGLFAKRKYAYLCLCEKELLTRLSFMKTVKGYRELYDTIRNVSKELFDVDDDQDLLSEKRFEKLNRICKYNLDEWLFEQLDLIRKHHLLEIPTFFMPPLTDKERIRIAIYGAGNVGKDFFIQSMRRGDIEVVCWVDRNYKNLGFPVQSPDVLLDNDYDLVVIAVSNKVMAETIINSLLERGITKDKLFFKEPESV